ncbi:MAG TPA: SDR family oxidoreductase [Acidimicrobiales bacterium]|nr:SDR family oxidoreductase [Acidimicrobiales bacterium]
MNDKKVAFVTGASRGIGKAIAVHLARAGMDVALTARTVEEGEAREHSSTLHRSDTRPLPGSLSSTAALVEGAGARSLRVPADLLERATLGAAAALVEERWGRIDVLVNNGRYIGPGHMDQIIDTPLELLDRHLEANVMAPLVLIKQVLPGMLARGGGTIINVSSGSGATDPPAPAGHGGWGVGYGMSKGAMNRIAGVLAVELGDRGIRAYNLEPGFVATERMVMDMAEFGFDASTGIPVDVPGAVAAWLVTDPAAADPNGRTVDAPSVCRELRLLPGWG